MAVELRSRRHKRNKDGNNNKDPPKKKSKEVSELREFTLQEITRLSDEICHLEEEIVQKESLCADDYTIETLQKISTDFCDGEGSTDLAGSSKEGRISKSGEEIDVLNKRLHSLEALTGVVFHENRISVLSRTNTESVLNRRMSGTCQMIPFSVDFEVKEDEQNEAIRPTENRDTEELEPSPPVITKLKVNITHPLSEQELSDFIISVEQEKALQPFFTGLMQYADWCCHRQRTFDHFKTKYPDLVHVTGGSAHSVSVQLRNANKPGLLFTVYWKLEISPAGHVVPDFQIHATAPQNRSREKKRSSLLRAVPQQFRRVLPLLGIEQSIEVVIGMIKG